MGLFVTIEGVDGAGKSSLVSRLAARLRADGRAVRETREPGGTAGAEAIRGLLLGGAADSWSPETEALLFTAARRDHLERVIAPALARGEIVLCDRFVDSTRAYQSAAGGEARALVDALHGLAIGRNPDLTLILDLSADAAAARRAARAAEGAPADRFEARDAAFQAQLRAAFREIAAAEPARCRLLDAGLAPDALAAAAHDAVRARLAAAG